MTLVAFQNCSENTFSDVNAVSSKLDGNIGPDLSDVAPEDEETAQEYYSCEDDDSDSSDDMDSESSDDNDRVAVCINQQLLCLDDTALEAHIAAGGEGNYGDCDYDDDSDSESSDDDDSESSDDDQSDS